MADTTMAASVIPAETAAGEPSEFRRGWSIIVASLIGIGCGLAAFPFYTMGVFAPHLAREFGWSVGEIMGSLTVTTLSVVIAGPVAGSLCDRYGTRPVALVSLALFGLSYLSLALLTSSLVQFYVTFAVIATTGAGTLPITFTRTINRWFDCNRGLALGLAMMGTGVFGILCKPLLAWVIGPDQWRTGFLVLGALPEPGAERRQRKILGGDRGDVGLARGERLGDLLDLGDLGGAERHQPLGALGDLGAIPGGGAGLLRRQFERHDNQAASQGKRGANS